MTSESDSIRENKPTPNAEGESTKKSSHPEIPVPLTPTPKSECQPTKGHCEITCKTEKNWWDKTKPFVEMGGAILLAIYTLYTVRMYCVNKIAADAAKRSADATTTALHLDQRAWVIPTAKMPQLKNREVIRVPFTLLNTGKTPALEFGGVIVVNLLPESEAPEFIYTKGTGHPHYRIPGTIFYPNNPAEYSFPVIDRTVKQTTDVIHGVVLTPAIRKQLDSGTAWVVAHGELGYKDISGIVHWAHFCYPLSPNSRGIDDSIQKCAAFNAVDTNQ